MATLSSSSSFPVTSSPVELSIILVILFMPKVVLAIIFVNIELSITPTTTPKTPSSFSTGFT